MWKMEGYFIQVTNFMSLISSMENYQEKAGGIMPFLKTRGKRGT